MRKLTKTLLSYLPSPLPVGRAEFETWSNAIIDLAGPYADPASMKYALASNVMHMKHDVGSVPKAYFVKVLRKAAANQVASQVFVDIKEAQLEAAKAAQEAAKLAEATAQVQDGQQVANDEQRKE